MASDPVRILLRFEPLDWREPGGNPSNNDLLQLLYTLDVAYAESFPQDRLRRRGQHSTLWYEDWYVPATQWGRLFAPLAGDVGVPHRTPEGPPATEDPTKYPLRVAGPYVEGPLELRVEALVMASPLELVMTISAAGVTALGSYGIFKFVKAIEDAWNAPKRVRVEGAKLDKEYWDEKLAAEESRARWQRHRHSQRFELLEGSVEFRESPPKLPPADDESSSG